MAASILPYLFASFVVRAITASPSPLNEAASITPIHGNDTDHSAHGELIAPERIVLKLDCPGCPAIGRDLGSESTSLVSTSPIVINHRL